MNLPTAKTLSRAVEAAATRDGVTARRMRRWIGAIALIETLNVARVQGILPRFIVKGGFALEFRFRSESRASRDIDIVLPLERGDLMDAAIEALRLEWSGFSFRIKGTPVEAERSFRIEVSALYQNKEWSTFDVELVFGPVGADEPIEPLDLAAFGLLRPGDIPCMTVAEQIAQKLHAVTDPDENRPRDLIDIYLLDTRLPRLDATLLDHCLTTFERRAKQPWPPNIVVQDGWNAQLEALIAQFQLSITVDHVVRGVRALVNRLLGLDMPKNFRYHFLVLSGSPSVPSIMQDAIEHDEGYNVLRRMTEEEGWRLAHILRYPSRDVTRAILAVLEQPVDVKE